MYKVDMFANTGFNSVDIPSGPALVYQIAKDDFSKPAGDVDAVKWYQFSDINIVQDEWEANVILPKEAILMRNGSTGINVDFDNKEARHIDYVIIVDDDHYNSNDWYYYTSCYTVKNYQDVGNCIKFNLLLDPYTTMGGFEFDYGNHVISGSANRLTVPLAPYVDKNGNSESTPGYEHYKNIYTCREDNHFFSLDEPYQNRHPEVYTRGTYVPPTPPPVPPVDDNIGFMNSPDYYLTAPMVWGFSSRNWLNSNPPWPEHVLSSDCCNVAGFQIHPTVNPWDYEFNYGAHNVKNDIINWFPQFKVQHPDVSDEFYNYMLQACIDYCNSGEIEAAIEKFEELRDEAPEWSQCSIRSFVRYIRNNGGQYANPTGFYKTLAIYKGSTTVFEETHYYRANLYDPWTAITGEKNDKVRNRKSK